MMTEAEKKLIQSDSMRNISRALYSILGIIFLGICSVYFLQPEPAVVQEDVPMNEDGIVLVDGKDEATGMIYAEGYELVKRNCLGCHSSKLITQNRMTAEGWLKTIKWMQESQKLWDLGRNEALIVKYLAENYAPESKGRRPRLKDIEWYEME